MSFASPSRRVRALLSSCALVMAAGLPAPFPASAQEGLLLDEISVTANLVPTPAAQVGSAVTVITGEELRQQQIKFVSDALRQVPGLAVNRTGPVGQLTQVRIRGSEGNQTLVMIDGIPVNDPSAGSEFDFANLLTDDIERIEVLRGPQSALYGSDAIGGVVNIITRSGEPGLSAGARVEGGSFGTVNGNASISGGGKDWSFIVSGAGFQSEGISVADARLGNTEEDGYENATAFAKGSYSPLDNLDLSVVARYTGFRADGDASLGGVGAVDADQDSKGELFFGRAQARLLLLGGHWEQIAGVSYTDQDRDYRTEGAVTSTYKGRRARADYQSNVFFDTPSLLDASHTVTLAVQYDEDGVVSESAWSDLDRSIRSTGFIGQYQLALLDGLALSGAIRHDDNDFFADATTYRFTAAYDIAATGTKLRGSYGTGVKNPTLFELFGYTQNYRGNPDLKPETAEGWDVGIDQLLWDGRAILDVTYFNQRIGDLITGSGQTSINLPGTSRIDGVEVGLTVALLDGLTVRGAYTYMKGEDSTGADLVRRPRHLGSLDVNYRFLDDRANVNLAVVHNGEQKDWAYDAAYDRSVVTLDAYTLVNVAGSYQLNENVQLYGRIENLLDEHYQEVYTYGTPGIAGYAGLRLTF